VLKTAIARIGAALAAERRADSLEGMRNNSTPETVEQARSRATEIIDLADRDVLDLLSSRAVEQDVQDLLDEPAPR
jgi:hypothetical protein